MSERDPWIGRTLAGRYRLLSELGRGGMAIVYRAEDDKLEREVAVKVIRDDISASLGLERFQKEIRVLSTLTHPNIVGLIDSGSVEGTLYYVMPLIAGQSLRERLDREGRLPIEEAVQVTAEACAALAHAHDKGIVHRDIKPENVMLVGQTAMVTDFGIAKALGESSDDRLTSTGVAIGTVGYMSPEQSLGSASIDARSDQYSLAAVLYEMLTGEPPFTGPNAQTVIARKNTEVARAIRPVRETVSAGLEAVVLRALARDPVDRYPTTEAFRAALISVPARSTSGEVSAPRPVAPLPTADRRRRTRLAGLVGLVAIAVAGGLLASRAGIFGPSGGGAVEVWSPTNRARIAFLKCRADGQPDAIGSGILAAITSRLQSVRSVMPLTSSATDRFADSSLGSDAIADSLAADYLSSCVVGDREIEFTLADRRGRRLWSERFTAADVVGETTVVTLLARIGIEPGADELEAIRSYQSISPVADSLYQLSLGYRAMSNDSLNNAAMGLLERAVEEDPSFGLGWAALSGVYSQRVRNLGQYYDRAESTLNATRMAETAIRFAPLIAQSHVAMASVQMFVNFDFAGAEGSLRAALLLSPAHRQANVLRAFLYAWKGHRDSAMASVERALESAPMDKDLFLDHGFISYLVGDHETAIADYRWANQFTGKPEDNGLLDWALIEAGRLDEAGATEDGYCDAGIAEPCRTAPLYLAAARGETDRILDAARALRQENVPWRPNHAFDLAQFFAMAGMTDSAFAALEEAAAGPSSWLTRFRIDPHFKNLRSDPRFDQLADRLGLPPLQQ